MNYFHSIHTILIYLLIYTTNSIISLTQLAHFNSSGPITIFSVKLTNLGKSVYVSLNDTDGVVKIKLYNISTGSWNNQKNYIQIAPMTIIPNQIILYSTYVIGLQTTHINFTGFHSTDTVNQTVSQYIQSPSQGIVIYVSTIGSLYWILVSDFPLGGYKHFIMSGVLGTPKAVISPNTNYLVVGGSSDNKIYLIQLTNKTVVRIYTINGVDTRAMSWTNDSAKVYVATPSQGLIYQLLITSPYTIKAYKYEVANTVTTYHIQYYWNTTQVAVFAYKTSRSNTLVYSFYIPSCFVYFKGNISNSNVLIGSYWDKTSTNIFADWTSTQIWIKQVTVYCPSGSYYDQCTMSCTPCNINMFCMFCSQMCGGFCMKPNATVTTNATSAAPVVVNTTNTTNVTVAANTTNTTAVVTNNTIIANTTINSTIIANTTINSTIIPNTTVNTTILPNITSNVTINATNNTTTNTSTNTNSNTSSNNTFINNTNILPDHNNTQPINNQTIPNSFESDSKGHLYQNFAYLLDNTIGSPAIQSLNKVPGGRRIFMPLFIFFGNLDDFWLYIYHDRNYQFVITLTFQAVKNLQNQKWTIIPYQQLWGYAGVNATKIKPLFNSKSIYSSQKFNDVQGNPNGFYINFINFFLSNMIITVLMFLVCRLFFYILFKYRLSVFVRKFSFWPYLIIILMQGNLQFASYTIAFQFQWLFNINPVNKLFTVYLIFLFYCIFFLSIGFYFLLQYFYGDLVKYFLQNFENTVEGATNIMVHSCLRNVLFGFVHYMSFQCYKNKIVTLFMIQLIFLTFGIIMLATRKIVNGYKKAWTYITTGFIRLLVISIFYFEQNVTTQDEITNTSPIFVYLIGSYILIGLLSVINELIVIIFELLGFFRSSYLPNIDLDDDNVMTYKMVLANKQRMKITIYDGDDNFERFKGVNVQRINLDLQSIRDRIGNKVRFRQQQKKNRGAKYERSNKYDKTVKYDRTIKYINSSNNNRSKVIRLKQLVRQKVNIFEIRQFQLQNSRINLNGTQVSNRINDKISSQQNKYNNRQNDKTNNKYNKANNKYNKTSYKVNNNNNGIKSQVNNRLNRNEYSNTQDEQDKYEVSISKININNINTNKIFYNHINNNKQQNNKNIQQNNKNIKLNYKNIKLNNQNNTKLNQNQNHSITYQLKHMQHTF